MRITGFEQMWKLLDKKRCDLFPRSIYEGEAELAAAKTDYPNRVLFDNVILYSPFPMYFFFNKQNYKLAEQIEFGLRTALNDGSWQAYMEQHPFTSLIFPLKRWQNELVIELTLPTNTLTHDKSLWLKLH
jgi:hypothetical protein